MLLYLNNVCVKMLNSSCESDILDQVSKIEQYNYEVEPMNDDVKISLIFWEIDNMQ